jgi:c-di-GMP-binding flagellar brake protein YcgR
MPGLSRHESQKQRCPERESITSPTRITAILNELEARGELLNAAVAGHEERYRVAILEVCDNESFRLDRLASETAHRALLDSGELHLACRLRGMQLSFTVRLMDAEPEPGLAGYRLALPGSIDSAQRRKNLRLRIDAKIRVSVTVPDLDGETVRGDVFDLSTTGIGLFLHTRRTPARGRQLPGVTLQLPDERPIRCTLEIRFVHKNAMYRTLRVGARFVGLEPQQQTLIERFLARPQRRR